MIRDLLVRYEEVTPHGRPVVHDNTTVDVQFGLGLIQMELDEKEKALSLSLWAKYVICRHFHACNLRFSDIYMEAKDNIYQYLYVEIVIYLVCKTSFGRPQPAI